MRRRLAGGRRRVKHMIYKLLQTRVTAVQWVPENADAIIKELTWPGMLPGDVEVNGFNLILWDGNVNLSVTPGQWVVVAFGRPFMVYADRIGKYLDLETPIG